MGIIKAVTGSIGGALADQWLETIEPYEIDRNVLATYGIKVRKGDKRSSNTKGTEDVISNGSIIHVPENTYMLLVDGGKVISATDEAGYYQVDNSRAPSIFFSSTSEQPIAGYGNTGTNSIQRPGGLKNTIKDSWERFKFGGATPLKQTVIYINKMEIPDIRFGTKNPVPYTDRVLVPGRPVLCKITSFGTYSIKISDPILFYSEVCSKTGKDNFVKDEMAEQYVNEFLNAYETSLASLSMQNVMVSDIPIKRMELAQYMAETLDNSWLEQRGFFIQSVAILGVNYDEKTDELLSKYSNDSILFDPNARAARMTGSVAAGLEAAGSNANGSMMGFAGIGMGMNAMGGNGIGNVMNPTVGTPPTPPTAPASVPQEAPVDSSTASSWICSCGHTNTGKFCSSCGTKKPESVEWTCECGHMNKGKFCSNCGKPKQNETAKYQCNKCGWVPEDPTNPPKFCPECGDVFDITDRK